jgi:hypothetical protein
MLMAAPVAYQLGIIQAALKGASPLSHYTWGNNMQGEDFCTMLISGSSYVDIVYHNAYHINVCTMYVCMQ